MPLYDTIRNWKKSLIFLFSMAFGYCHLTTRIKIKIKHVNYISPKPMHSKTVRFHMNSKKNDEPKPHTLSVRRKQIMPFFYSYNKCIYLNLHLTQYKNNLLGWVTFLNDTTKINWKITENTLFLYQFSKNKNTFVLIQHLFSLIKQKLWYFRIIFSSKIQEYTFSIKQSNKKKIYWILNVFHTKITFETTINRSLSLKLQLRYRNCTLDVID